MAARLRVGNQCEFCGMSGEHVHHVTTYSPSPCRHCRYWERREGGEDCAKGLLIRQPTCRGFEREVGADDDLPGDDEHDHG